MIYFTNPYQVPAFLKIRSMGMNLLCSATQAGDPSAELGDNRTVDGKQVVYPVNCGDTAVDRVPYYIFVVLMFGTTYYQQRQMQKASPPCAASQQQQALLRIMLLMFGVFGIFFPSGLVVYWTTSNVWQIGQQYFMLKSRPTAEMLAARAAQSGKTGKKGFMSSMTERAEQERRRREQATGKKPGAPRKPGPAKPGTSGRGKGSSGSKGSTGRPSWGPGPQNAKKPELPGEGDPGGPETGDDGAGDPGDRPERLDGRSAASARKRAERDDPFGRGYSTSSCAGAD